MVQIRNMPEQMHRTLKSRAALEGMSLSAYLLREMETLAEKPTWAELEERMRNRKPARVRETSAQAVRAIRGQ